MSADTIGDILDERGTEIAACPLDCPFRYGMNSKIVVAVDPERGDAETKTARSESAGAAAGDALEGRDRPLIVHDVEHHRSLVGGGENQARRGSPIRRSQPSPIHAAAIFVSFLIADAMAQPTA